MLRQEIEMKSLDINYAVSSAAKIETPALTRYLLYRQTVFIVEVFYLSARTS